MIDNTRFELIVSVVQFCILNGYADTAYIYARLLGRAGKDYESFSDAAMRAAANDLARARGWTFEKAIEKINRLIGE